LVGQLSGGDLDGDLYNVIFEPTLMPQRDIAPPADYPRVPGMELDREVTINDMSSFFVQFMETDQLGQICTRHLQLADQKPFGVFDPGCIKLASMASTAVDFSKTGIAVSSSFPCHKPKHREHAPSWGTSVRLMAQCCCHYREQAGVENDTIQHMNKFDSM
jgi:hypothetical protein